MPQTFYATFVEAKQEDQSFSSLFGSLLSYVPIPSFSWRFSWLRWPSSSFAWYLLISFLSAAPFVPYTLTADPAKIGLAWWASLSRFTQLFLIINAFAYLLMGCVTRVGYFRHAVGNLRELFSNLFKDLITFISTSLLLLASLLTSVPMATLGYYGAIWGGIVLAIFSGLANLVVTMVFRLVFLPGFLISLKNLWDPHAIFQQKIINQLADINPAYEGELLDYLANKSIDEQTIYEFMFHLYSKKLDGTPVFQPSYWQYALKVRSGISQSIAALTAAGFYIFMSQGSYEGYRLLILFALGMNMDNLPFIAKQLTTVLSGTVAAILAYLATFALFNQVIPDMLHHLWHKPLLIPLAVLSFICCMLTSLSMINAGLSIASKDNLFGLKTDSDSWLAQGYLVFYLIGLVVQAMAFDFSAFLKATGLLESPTPPSKIEQVKIYLQEKRLSKSSLDGLMRHSLLTNRTCSNDLAVWELVDRAAENEGLMSA